MKSKFFIPALAMFFAISMSFASSNDDIDQSMDYVQTDNGVVPIEEVDCGPGSIPCQGRFSPNGKPYPIYDDASLTIRKTGTGHVLDLLQ